MFSLRHAGGCSITKRCASHPIHLQVQHQHNKLCRLKAIPQLHHTTRMNSIHHVNFPLDFISTNTSQSNFLNKLSSECLSCLLGHTPVHRTKPTPAVNNIALDSTTPLENKRTSNGKHVKAQHHNKIQNTTVQQGQRIYKWRLQVVNCGKSSSSSRHAVWEVKQQQGLEFLSVLLTFPVRTPQHSDLQHVRSSAQLAVCLPPISSRGKEQGRCQAVKSHENALPRCVIHRSFSIN